MSVIESEGITQKGNKYYLTQFVCDSCGCSMSSRQQHDNDGICNLCKPMEHLPKETLEINFVFSNDVTILIYEDYEKELEERHKGKVYSFKGLKDVCNNLN